MGKEGCTIKQFKEIRPISRREWCKKQETPDRTFSF
jgi:hypothetical protein